MANTLPNSSTQSSRHVWKKSVLALFGLGSVVWLSTCLFMVDETEFVIVERLGTIAAVYDTPASRGLHFKLPWPIEIAKPFDRRIQFFDPPGREVFTRDKKNISVSAYINWRIADPDTSSADATDHPVVRFYRGLGSAATAESRLETRLRSILTTEVGRIELDRLLEVESTETGPADSDGGLLDEISRNIAREVRQRSDETESLAERLGIEVVDVRVRRVNFPEGNQQSVFERMKSERRKIAERYRSAGQADSQMIRSRADRQYAELLARAEGDAERIRGQAEADAVGILNQAHALDPEFYQTLRTFDAYRTFINDRTTLVLSSASPLLRLLTEGLPPVEEGALRSSPPISVDQPADSPEPLKTGDVARTSPKEGE